LVASSTFNSNVSVKMGPVLSDLLSALPSSPGSGIYRWSPGYGVDCSATKFALPISHSRFGRDCGGRKLGFESENSLFSGSSSSRTLMPSMSI